jgi:glycosyltransferase involved in cell wall biosynthesis
MRILAIINTLDLGGAETLLCDLAPALQRLGAETDVLCLSAREFPLERELHQKGIMVVHGTRPSPYSPLQIVAVKKQVSKGNYDVVHSHLFPAQLWTAMGAELANSRIPLVTTEHNTWNRRRKWYFRPLDRWMYKKYAAIACIGATTESALQNWLPDRPLPTKVVLNGINLARFDQAGASRKLPKFDKSLTTLICVASLNDRKGQDVLLRAASLLPDTEVLLVGEGPGRPALKRLAEELGISRRVQFLGIRRDIPDLLAASDIYVQPSRWEGFGIAAVEAMAAGLPVIASDVPGLREGVGDSGLLFEAGSHYSLKDCIERLIGEPNSRKELASRAVSRAQQFTVETTALAYLRLYESVCRRPPRHCAANGQVA